SAVAPEHPEVEQFLRGPEEEMTYTRSGTFSNLRQADKFCNKYFSGYFGARRGFSARCEPRARGRSAYVTITKKTVVFDEKRRAYDQDMAEAVVLRALLSSSHGNEIGGGSGGGASGVGRSRWVPS
ncbi:unnamed protein product, partial [Hapterophycus canaliculatus]